MASFSWQNVMCFDIWWTFGALRSAHRGTRHSRERRRFLLYSLYSWGEPSIVTLWTALMNEVGADMPEALQPSIGKGSCYIMRGTAARLVFFAIPVTVQILCNVVLYVLTAWHCSKVKAEIYRFNNPDRRKKYLADKDKLLMNFKLFVVMGMGWVAEVISTFIVYPAWVWYLTDASNALQGLLIFCIFVMKRKVLHRLSRKLGISTTLTNAKSDNCIDPYRIRKSASSSTLCTNTDTRNSGSPSASHRLAK